MTGQRDLISGVPPDRLRVHALDHLLFGLGLRKPDRLRRLQRCAGGSDLLDQRDPVNAVRIANLGAISDRCTETIQDFVNQTNNPSADALGGSIKASAVMAQTLRDPSDKIEHQFDDSRLTASNRHLSRGPQASRLETDRPCPRISTAADASFWI